MRTENSETRPGNRAGLATQPCSEPYPVSKGSQRPVLRGEGGKGASQKDTNRVVPVFVCFLFSFIVCLFYFYFYFILLLVAPYRKPAARSKKDKKQFSHNIKSLPTIRSAPKKKDRH